MRIGGRHVHYHMDVGFISTYAITESVPVTA